jgi:hypothetical protein
MGNAGCEKSFISFTFGYGSYPPTKRPEGGHQDPYLDHTGFHSISDAILYYLC